MDELPLATRMENATKQRRFEALSKYSNNSDDYKNSLINELKEWQPKESQVSTNINKNKNNNQAPKGSGNLKVTMIDKNGKIENFNDLNAMQNAVSRRIDTKIEERVNARDLVFRESNPWTYTVEEAAELGLLSDIPKDYFAQQKAQKMAKLEAKHKAQRYAPDWEVVANIDDGSQLHVGQIDYHEVGGIKTYTQRDIEKNNKDEKKHVDDMNDQEYEQYIQEKRAWDAFVSDNTKGSGNPYFHG